MNRNQSRASYHGLCKSQPWSWACRPSSGSSPRRGSRATLRRSNAAGPAELAALRQDDSVELIKSKNGDVPSTTRWALPVQVRHGGYKEGHLVHLWTLWLSKGAERRPTQEKIRSHSCAQNTEKIERGELIESYEKNESAHVDARRKLYQDRRSPSLCTMNCDVLQFLKKNQNVAGARTLQNRLLLARRISGLFLLFSTEGGKCSAFNLCRGFQAWAIQP